MYQISVFRLYVFQINEVMHFNDLCSILFSLSFKSFYKLLFIYI